MKPRYTTPIQYPSKQDHLRLKALATILSHKYNKKVTIGMTIRIMLDQAVKESGMDIPQWKSGT